MTTHLSPESLSAIETEMGIPAFKIGDAVWFVPTHRLGVAPHYETVTKITRLWVHTDHGNKFRASEMCVRYGKYFRSVDEYDAEQRRNWAWTHFLLAVGRARYCCPKNVSADDIYEASLLLRLNILEGKVR